VPRPLYETVKEHVRRRVRAGTWKAGDRIPSEHELVAALGVSRMTVHRALREMAARGELVRLAGVGTFIGEDRPQSGLMRVADIASEIRARGHAYSCEMVGVAHEPAPPDAAAALGLEAGSAVYHSVCVHRENGAPVQLEDRYVNPRAAPDFIAQDFTRVRPAEYLLRAVPLDEVEHVVDAVRPTKREAAMLRIPQSEPCLVLTRRTWSNEDVVTFVRCVHPGSRYRLGTRFKTRGPQPVA
jgi:GntR family transcriptional regulator, histidine utilization repressor